MNVDSSARKIALASRRLLDKEGADAVTMRKVARSVGLSAMAIYRHYPDRDGLLNAVADEGFRELAARLEQLHTGGDFERRLMRMGEALLDHALENPRLFELMFLKPRAGARQYPHDFEAGASPTANPMADLVREAMTAGYFRQDNVWEIVFEIGALSHGLIMLYLGGRLSLTPSRFRSFYRRSFRRYIHGIRK